VLVAALSWNEFAKNFIAAIYPVSVDSKKKTAMANLMYALFVTAIVIFLVFTFNYTSEKINKPAEPKIITELQYAKKDSFNSYH